MENDEKLENSVDDEVFESNTSPKNNPKSNIDDNQSEKDVEDDISDGIIKEPHKLSALKMLKFPDYVKNDEKSSSYIRNKSFTNSFQHNIQNSASIEGRRFSHDSYGFHKNYYNHVSLYRFEWIFYGGMSFVNRESFRVHVCTIRP